MNSTIRIFLLSPARSTGKRAQMLLRNEATFELAERVRASSAPLGEVFSFLSGLYFRGKFTYANKFSQSHGSLPGVWIIVSHCGLVPADARVTIDDLKSFGSVEIDASDEQYVRLLQSSAKELRSRLPENHEIVLLGSISTKKYVDPLLDVFGDRLKFPSDFVGRGDMSRGGLLLRCVTSEQELEYLPVRGAILHGKRPPKLKPLK